MSKKTSKNRNTNKALKALKRKRAKVFAGGGGFANFNQDEASRYYQNQQQIEKAENTQTGVATPQEITKSLDGTLTLTLQQQQQQMKSF